MDIISDERNDMGNVINSELSPDQEGAVAQAHEVGRSGQGPYTPAEIFRKARILREADIPDTVRRMIMETGRAGVPERTGMERPGAGVSAYEKYPYLQAHEAFLGKLELCDIVGEGNNAVIVRHPSETDMVVKVAKPGEVDDLAQEYANHLDAYSALDYSKRAGSFNHGIRIPRIFHAPDATEGYFVMEKVQGQSLQTKCLIDRYAGRLPAALRPQLGSMSDGDVRTVLRGQLKMDDEWIARTIEDYSGDYLHPLLYDSLKPMEKTPLSRALDVLREAGVSHADVHPGNFMIAHDGTIYIIDFGRVKRSK